MYYVLPLLAMAAVDAVPQTPKMVPVRLLSSLTIMLI
jgi:hypothetical protein